jgi:hypothetical protein
MLNIYVSKIRKVRKVEERKLDKKKRLLKKERKVNSQTTKRNKEK